MAFEYRGVLDRMATVTITPINTVDSRRQFAMLLLATICQTDNKKDISE